MTKNKAFTLMLLTFALSAIIFYCLGVWHANEVNDQETAKLTRQYEKILQEKEDMYLGEIARHIILEDWQETIIRKLQTIGYIRTESSPDIERPSR